MKNNIKISLFIIILLAAFLRLYKLDQIPPSLNWDEAAGGYNAYAIANWGRDEWGKVFPLVFTSFRDDKHPVHVYLTAPIVKIFGLSDFTVRLPGALIGVFSVVVIFYLAKVFFKSNLTALLSAFFLAVSPYHIHFSRGLWEANFAPFFFMLGLLMFFLSLQKKSWYINLAFLSFGISLLTYHSSKIVVPSAVFLLIVLYFKDLKKLSLNFYTGIIIFSIFISILFLDQRLLGLARVKQTEFGQSEIEKTSIFQKTKNPILGMGEITLRQYLTHFTSQYLFISGDQSPRNSVKSHGEFYKIDALFLFVGALYLFKLRSKVSLLVFVWLLLAPLSSALVNGAPNAARAIFMVTAMNIVTGLGASSMVSWTGGKMKIVVFALIITFVSFQAYSFVDYYFNVYPKKDPHDWQYGMKQIVEFVKNHNGYNQIYVTDIRSQPYIFFLFYLKTNLPEYLNSVVYNDSEQSRSFNTVSYFKEGDRDFYFGGWDPIESTPQKGGLYIISPSQYDGLKYKAAFDVKKIIYYPDGSDAFFLVSGSN